MLNGIEEETSFYMQKKIIDIVNLMDKTRQKVKTNNSRIYSKDLIEVIFKQPYCKRKSLEEAGIAKRLTATKYLDELEKMGILKSIKVGKEKLYINIEFYKLLKE
jgi:Fic family protein